MKVGCRIVGFTADSLSQLGECLAALLLGGPASAAMGGRLMPCKPPSFAHSNAAPQSFLSYEFPFGVA